MFTSSRSDPPWFLLILWSMIWTGGGATLAAEDCAELLGRWGFGPSFAVAAIGDTVYLSSGTALAVADVSDPVSPHILGDVSLSDFPRGIVVVGGVAYVAANYAGLRVVDVSTPDAPIEIGFLDTGGRAGNLAVSGDYLYLAIGQPGLIVVDVSTPSAPVQIASLNTPGRAVDVAVAGDTAYVKRCQACKMQDGIV